MKDNEKVDRLAKVELFRHFDRNELRALARITEEASLPAGATLCEQGRVAQACYVVVSGEADVIVGEDQKIAAVGPGESVGEMGLLDHLPRSATVVARTPMEVYRIDAARFDALLAATPFASALLELLSRRIRDLEHSRQLLR